MRTTLSRVEKRPSRMLACAAAAALLVLGTPTARAQGQGRTIVGRVTEARSAQPISGAMIEVQGTRLGATADADGRYRIANVPTGPRLVIARRIGFSEQRRLVTVTENPETTVDFALQPAAIALDQVVITGTAGAEQRRSIGNVVATIDAATERAKSAAPDLSALLRARAPGVTLNAITGRIGAGPSISIRGPSSLGLGNSPLIYIDGVRINNASGVGPSGISGSLGTQGAQVANRLNDINPEDIESIEIIKGPAASTIYGTEATNGVIQIITKKGAAGQRTQFAGTVEMGAITFMNAADRVWTNYAKNSQTGQIETWNGVKQEADRGTPLFRTGQQRHYNMSVSGGRDETRFYVASAYQNDLGVEPNNAMRQFSTHANISTSIGQSTQLATSLNFVNVSSHLGADIGASALLGAIAGHSLLFPKARGFYPNFPPEVPQQLYDNADGINRFTGSGTVTNQPLPWFSQRAILGIDYTGEDARAIEHFAPPDLAGFLSSAQAGGRLGQTLRRNTIITVDYSGTARTNLRPSLTSAFSVGGQFYNTEANASFLGGFGFPGPNVETVSAAANPVASSQSQVVNTTIGAYVQEVLGWRERLFVTGGFRVDNNSAFGKDFKWVTYPKVAASWVVSEEPFWHVRPVSSLRLRLAYGESGRQPEAFSALRTYTPVPGPGGTNAITPNSAGNPNLRPERGKEWEGGFETALFDNLTIDFTYFNKRNLDEIVRQGVAPSSGFPGTQLINLGRVDSHGTELQARYNALRRRNLNWEISGQFATTKNTIKENVVNVAVTAGTANIIGYPINGLWARRVVSADRGANGFATNILCDGGTDAAGNVKPPIACASAPFVYVGNSTPTLSGSVGNTLNIGRRLRLYGLFDFKRGHSIYNQNELIRCVGLAGAPLCEANYYPEKYDPVYLAYTLTSAATQGIAAVYMQNASFVKLRELSATYTIPERFIPGASRALFTFAARDLRTWTKYGGLDPEGTTGGAIDQAVTPPLTRFIGTLSITW